MSLKTLVKLYIFFILHYFVSSKVYEFDDSVGVGRRFDGIGGLSGGGATSKLLVNYPEQQRNEILDYLFKPNFGASLQILKVEIGGDSQSTEGTEASHMHNSWDENYHRGYEWGVMVEAKKRNADIKLYALPWAFPGWVGKGSENPYKYPELTATYILKWIKGAKMYYNLTIDYIGIWNERPYDITYIKTLRNMLDSSGFQHVQIVASDGGWEIADDIAKDPQLASAVAYIGVHYPGTISTPQARSTGKQLWSSEDYSTFNNNVGGGCWARILNQNYVNGFMTSTISWNLIASYYEALPYPECGLMTADCPWSGNYVVKSPIWITAHTTQFTQIGWSYLAHDDGVGKFDNGGSYVGLISPDKKDLTIVIETMSHDHSECIRPPLPKYNVANQTVTLHLKGSLAGISKLNVWYTKLEFGGIESTLFRSLNPVNVKNGTLTLALGVDEVYTLTTLPTGQKGSYTDPPPCDPFPLPYQDDFEAYQVYSEPSNLAQQAGSFEVVKSENGQVLRQVVIGAPIRWCPIRIDFPNSVVGDGSWSDIYVEADTQLHVVNGTEGVFIAARVDRGGCESWHAQGIFFYLFPIGKKYIVANDIARTKMLDYGTASSAVGYGWNKLGLLIKQGYVSGSLNGQALFNITIPVQPLKGFVALGTDSYGLADFDNLKITSSQDSETLYFHPRIH